MNILDNLRLRDLRTDLAGLRTMMHTIRMFVVCSGSTLLGVRPAVNAAALSMLLVMFPAVENLACLLSSEVLLTLHGLGLRALTVSLVVPAALVPTTFVLPLGTLVFVPTAFVLFAHGFRHYIVSGENHDFGARPPEVKLFWRVTSCQPLLE